MGKSLKDRWALVTGASRGIGRAIALRLAEEGANLCIHFHKAKDEAEAVVAEAKQYNVQAVAYQADLGKRDQVLALVESVRGNGEISILVNNAGTNQDLPLKALSDEVWDAIISVNLTAPMILCRELGKRMYRAKTGRIVNITSIVGEIGGVAQAAYSASKGGLAAMTKSIAKEFAPNGVTVNAVSPGFISTDMMHAAGPALVEHLTKSAPIRRIGAPAEVAGLVAYLVSDEAAFIIGQEFGVNGGLHT